MKLKFNMVVAALALVSAGAANAALTLPANGNGSMGFVAIDDARSISLTIDLGQLMGDFLRTEGSMALTTPGSLSAAGTNVVWDFAANTRTVNGVSSVGNFQWSNAFSSFLSASGGNYQWGVLGGDNVSSTGAIFNRNMIATGTPTTTQMQAYTVSGNVGTGILNITNLFTANNSTGTHNVAGATGANTATGGAGFLWTTIRDTNNSTLTWSYLSAPGATTNLNVVHQLSDPNVYQVGDVYGVNGLAPVPATFTFNGSTLTYNVAAVPEADGIAMALAGLGMLGFIARRRRTA